MDDNITDVDGVSVIAKGGGVYEIHHASLAEPETERGKENAVTRAKQIAAAAKGDDDGGSMPEQGPLDPADAPAPTLENSENLNKIAELEAQLKSEREAREQAETRAKQLETRTVRTEGDAKPEGVVPAGVPREFSEAANPDTKKALKKLGIESVDIIVEENPDIPPTGLFVGHNGRGYMIRPGEKVTVPDFLLNVLNDAVMSSPIVDSKTQKVLGYRDRMKYPYRRV